MWNVFMVAKFMWNVFMVAKLMWKLFRGKLKMTTFTLNLTKTDRAEQEHNNYFIYTDEMLPLSGKNIF